MRLILNLTAALIILAATASRAQTPDPFQFVGISSDTQFGNAGVRSFALRCQSDYGAAARMCTSEEILETIVWPAPAAEAAWVRPVFNPVGGGGGVAVDASGKNDSPTNLTCDGWESTVGVTGLVVLRLAGFDTLLCDTPRPIACCKRVPEPSAALSLPVGVAGLVGLSMLKGGV